MLSFEIHALPLKKNPESICVLLIFLKTSSIAYMYDIIQLVIIAGYEGAEITRKYITNASTCSTVVHAHLVESLCTLNS